jgi:uncharacterized phage protein (TIGR01671 family)
MKDIKFRAWCENQKIWLHQEDEDTLIKDLYDLLKSLHYEESKMRDRVIIEQFTGLHDKNGKEIYEGDIVMANGHRLIKSHDASDARRYISSRIKNQYNSVIGVYKFICYWDNNFSQFDFNPTDKRDDIFPDVSDRDYEIIGNIHENSELLNK